MKKIVLFLLTIIVACQPSEKENKLIIESAIKAGNEISANAQKALGGELKKALTTGGPVHAVTFCNTAAYPILDTLSTTIPASIRRTALKWRNPANQPSESDTAVMEAFTDDSTEGNVPKAPTVIILPDDRVLYMRPIFLDNPLCLNCHGEPGSQISAETFERIRELYPNDNAVGFKMNDFRGMWSITFQQQDLLDFMSRNEP